MDPLISVIVPVYNVKDYLDECLESIVRQSYTHLEILVVDDGSTDGSGDLCDQWAKRDQRIASSKTKTSCLRRKLLSLKTLNSPSC